MAVREQGMKGSRGQSGTGAREEGGRAPLRYFTSAAPPPRTLAAAPQMVRTPPVFAAFGGEKSDVWHRLCYVISCSSAYSTVRVSQEHIPCVEIPRLDLRCLL